MKYILKGNPTSLHRPRFSGRSVYDSQRLLKMEIQKEIEEIHGDAPLYKGALLLKATFYLKIPKKSFKDNKLCNRLHIYRPDLSNLVKFIEDVCNKTLFDDDCLIAQIDAEKRYDYEPRTEFEIIEIPLD